MSDLQSASPVREGDIIAGKYRVERVLGIGGMGVVVAAMHIDLEQRVALKFLLAEATSHPEVAARFAREARAAAKIQSEHVAKVLDVSTLPNGSPYMVMEFMDGEDLEHVLVRMGPMPVDMATSYILQACEAIAEAHSQGIVHRDLKPANLFLARRPSGEPIVKVLDFGISKSTMTSSQASLTRTSSILGSPLYMSPEQMASAKSVDTRSDIWALGVVLYELLAKRAPFPAETMPELVAAVLQSQPDPLTMLRPDVPPALAMAVHRCLEKAPGQRFQNVAELAGAIAPFGPPRSDVSVERISHVLGLGAVPRYTQGGSPVAVPLQPYGQTGGGQPTGPNAGARTNAQWSGSISENAAPAGGGAKTALLIAIPAVLAIAATIGMVMAFKGQSTTPPVAPTTVAAAADPSAATPAPTDSAPAAPATGAAPTAAASAAAPDTATPPAGAPPTPAASPATAATHSAPASSPTSAAPATATAAATSSAAPAKPATPTCHMVSYFDGDGNKRFKKECK